VRQGAVAAGLRDWTISLKTIGLIGGMSWESTTLYYRQINELVRERLGGLHSAKIVLYSVDFHDVERLMSREDWDTISAVLARTAQTVEAAGADFLLLCTNTMHKVAAAIESAARIPLLHIADATAGEIKKTGLATVGLLGTRFTMEQEFYRERLQSAHGLTILTPDAADRDCIDRVIFDELCRGTINAASRDAYRRIIAELVDRGAQAVILGCTEISLLIQSQDSPVPLFDTTHIHARAAVDRALQEVDPLLG
jgi:aspartate racemase